MYLTQLDVHQVRNLKQIRLVPSPRCNIIYGANASGKTSLLEAIYLLSVARSFRTPHIKNVIAHEAPYLQVVAKIHSAQGQNHSIGLQRSANKTRIRIDGEDINQVAALSSLLPVQVINPDVHKILEQGPKYRRQFIDWGVFHVEHQFLNAWKTYYRILKQRNAALRQKAGLEAIKLWDGQLIQEAKQITLLRETYLQQLLPIFQQYVQKLLQLDVEISYQRGWNHDFSLTETLGGNLEKDRLRGFTSAGPHRAELEIFYLGKPVQTVFSRGQQKLLVCAMRLAQITHLKQQNQQQSLLLVDDLAAELDIQHRRNLVDLLIDTHAQLFITATEAEALELPSEIEQKMFHVEHGEVKEVVQ